MIHTYEAVSHHKIRRILHFCNPHNENIANKLARIARVYGMLSLVSLRHTMCQKNRKTI